MVKDNLILENDRELKEQTEDSCLPARFNPLKAYLVELQKYPVLSVEEERDVALKVYEKRDLNAVERLTVSNLRLVVKIAMSYYNTYLNILDLIQEGNVGLLHAVKKYNPYKGTKFSTYAQFWIRAYILQYIMNSWSLVKVGTTQSQRKLFFRLNKEKRRLQSLGIDTTPKALANSLQVKEEDVVDMQVRLACHDVCLDSPINDEGADTALDLLTSEDDVEHIVIQRESQNVLEEKIKALKTTLNEKESFILDNRLMAEEPKTLEEIGERFHISRERVRQIEHVVYKKAKASFNGDIAKLGVWPEYNYQNVSNTSIMGRLG